MFWSVWKRQWFQLQIILYRIEIQIIQAKFKGAPTIAYSYHLIESRSICVMEKCKAGTSRSDALAIFFAASELYKRDDVDGPE